MKLSIRTLVLLLLLPLSAVLAQENLAWKPVEGRIATKWAAQVSPDSVLKEYPRPQLQRGEWQSLNGLWDYSIVPADDSTNFPDSAMGRILVPFVPEASLSGVGKTVGKDSVLWYRRAFKVPKKVRNKRIILHFGAVDWHTKVWVNDKPAGEHKGGYDPFSFDITDLIAKGNTQSLRVRVWDPSDQGPQPRGKQVKNPVGIFYTPVTGIWQTVWLEVVPETYIASLKVTPNVDSKTVVVEPGIKNPEAGDMLKITALSDGKEIAMIEAPTGEKATLSIPEPSLWSPENPFLYDLTVSIIRKNKPLDDVKSYFGMRKITMKPDANGVQRMWLNDKFLFQLGPLDQGWWPDGLYTAPTDEALRFDVERTKEMGFNMIRKHVKVEPARWYYHCDKTGILVWQDMPSGDMGNRWEQRPGIVGLQTERERTPESENIYKTEWKAIMDALHHFPSIVVWVPFNEAWGQFKTKEITEWTMQYDPSRLVNSASGGNFIKTGHIIDMHNYPDAVMPDASIYGKDQIVVLGEFGGLGLPIEGHTWQQKDNWGYQNFKNTDELSERFSNIMKDLKKLIPKGLSAAVYTQTTDVEGESNGLMTYDREVTKIPEEKLREMLKPLYED